MNERDQELKRDKDKDPWELLPYDALRDVVKVLAFGATKYQPRGWEGGMDYSRVYGALQRHLTAWWGRETNAEDSGLRHLAHAACNVLFLLAYEIREKGKDDRPWNF